jgi:ATP-binding cassette subfamily C protein
MKILRTLRKLAAEVVATSPRKAAASIALMAAVSVTEGVGLLLLMPLLGLVGIGETTTMPNVDGWFTGAFKAVGMTPTLGSVLVFFVSIAGLRALIMRLQSWVNVALREEFTSRMRVRVYRAIVGAEWKFLVTRRLPEFVHVLAGEIGRVGSAAFQIIDLAVLVAVSVVYLGLAFHLSAVMAALVVSCAAVLAWAVRRTLADAKTSGGRASTARAKLHVAIAEHMSSMKTAKSYGAVDRHTDIFKKLSGELREVSLEMTTEENKLQQNLELASTLILAVIVYVSFEILALPAAQLLVLLFIFAQLMPRLVTIYRRVQALASALPIFDSVTDLEGECLAAAESAIVENEFAPPQLIRFECVSFIYLVRIETPALCELSFEIRAGQTTAIVGPSGAGKSTLADLFMGLLSPTAGRILIDGQPLSANRIAGWRRHISYVPQEAFLFHDTVRANLAWARPGATEEELWQALCLSAADKFVAGLPQGLDTIVGERGVLLSGGERQRLSLARALVRRPRILVLDEATSSLDSENEQQIQKAVERLHRQMTIVIITHRLSTIRHADSIFVLDTGRLVECGTWDELLARKSGRFSDLCGAQGFYRRAVQTPVVLDRRRAAN